MVSKSKLLLKGREWYRMNCAPAGGNIECNGQNYLVGKGQIVNHHLGWPEDLFSGPVASLERRANRVVGLVRRPRGRGGGLA
jgi:hypothetical protein